MYRAFSLVAHPSEAAVSGAEADITGRLRRLTTQKGTMGEKEHHDEDSCAVMVSVAPEPVACSLVLRGASRTNLPKERGAQIFRPGTSPCVAYGSCMYVHPGHALKCTSGAPPSLPGPVPSLRGAAAPRGSSDAEPRDNPHHQSSTWPSPPRLAYISTNHDRHQSLRRSTVARMNQW